MVCSHIKTKSLPSEVQQPGVTDWRNMSNHSAHNLTTEMGGNRKSSKLLKRLVVCLAGAILLLFVPVRTTSVRAQGSVCGAFTDVSGTGRLCAAKSNGHVLRSGGRFHSAPGKKTAIGKTWTPSSTAGGIAINVAGQVNDVVTDGTSTRTLAGPDGVYSDDWHRYPNPNSFILS